MTPEKALRVAAVVASALTLFFTFRVVVPGLVNMQNDGALLGALVIALAVPTAVGVWIVLVWKETEK